MKHMVFLVSLHGYVPWAWLRLLTALLLALSGGVCHAADTDSGPGKTKRTGETLILLNAGESQLVSYGLYCMTSASRAGSNAPVGGDLLLILRNNGAKSIDMEDFTVEDFALRDARGRNVKIYLWNVPRTMGYGDSTVVHLVADHVAEAPEPWTLRCKSKPTAMAQIDLTISGIEPRRVVGKNEEHR